jgi:hypothetical protein
MRRLCTDSSCSYSGRSVRNGGVIGRERVSARRVRWLTKTQARRSRCHCVASE